MERRSSKAAAGKRLLVAAALTLLLAACAPTRVDTNFSSGNGPLPPPQTIIVQDFAPPAGGAVADRGLGARLGRALNGTAASTEGEETAAKAVDALARTLVEELRAAGLPATRSNDVAPTAGRVVIVSGQLLSVDEGNRTRRNLIGFGAGHSDVTAAAQVYFAGDGQAPQLIRSFTADAQSGRKPGAVATAGVGEATGRLAETAAVGAGTSTASELLSANTEADAKRMGKEIAKNVAALFAPLR